MARATIQPELPLEDRERRSCDPQGRMAGLAAASALFARAVSVAQVAQVIVQQAIELCGASGAALLRVCDGGTALESLRSDGSLPRLHELGDGWRALAVPAGEAARDGALRLYDESLAPLEAGAQPKAAHLCVFLAVEGRTIGALWAALPERRSIDEEERLFLLTLGSICAEALRRARLHEEAERARAEAERAAVRASRLQAVAGALSQTLTVEKVTEVIVVEGGSALGAASGAVALLDGDRLALRHATGFTEAERACLASVPLDRAQPLAEAARTGEPVWLESEAEWRARYPEIADTVAPSRAATGCVPLMVEGVVVGALGFSFGPARPLGAETRDLLLSLGRMCAQWIERARLYQAERQAREEAEGAEAALSFLEQASTMLAASLDYDATLRSVARLAVPVLADWCAVDILDGEEVRRVAIHHLGPERIFPEAEPQGPLARVLRTGEPALLPDGIPGLQAVGLGSCLVVPLRARRRTLGAITLALAGDTRRHGDDELALAIELARRAALAVENARLYEAEQRARRRAERAAERTARLQAVTATLSTAVTAAEVARAVVAEGANALGAHSGATWLLADDGVTLELAAQVHYPPQLEEALRRIHLGARVPIAEAVLAREPRFTEHGMACLPLVFEDRIVGGIAFTFPRTLCDDNDRAFAITLARQCAQALERARLREEEQRTRAELSQAVHARDEFLSIASHELKTPLSALHLRIEGLLRIVRRAPSGGLPPDRLRTRLEAIEEQVRRQAKLINQLLDVSRITSGRVEIDREEVDLAALAQAVVARFGEELAKAGSGVRVSIDGPVVGRWDRLRIEQVIVNLLSNAIKYGCRRPIEVQVRGDEGHARLTVRDHGIGIASEHQARIFGRFERAVSERHYGGLGLGLWISRQIVLAHGGRIEVASQLGAGATFLVELPRG